MPEKKKNEKVFGTSSRDDWKTGVNPEILKMLRSRGLLSSEEYISGILGGDRNILARAITLVESSNPAHFDLAQSVVEGCLKYSGNSVRIGITGIPGAGKSTFIEAFGTMLTGMGKKVAVLAIDPSSANTGGSILGDKTRMTKLANDPDAFIRPSPSAGTPEGVARKTRESIILCEAAGFDTIIVETVGVGQSEIAVSTMVDIFILLLVAGTGDELQGIKRGIMELADIVVVNKADGDNKKKAEMSASEFRNALHCFPVPPSGISPLVTICSAKEGTGIKEIWEAVRDFISRVKENGYFEKRREKQAVERMHDFIKDYLIYSFYRNDEVKTCRGQVEDLLKKAEITSYRAAFILLNKYFKK